MRESPQANQMKAREMFLECHRQKIISDYRLPSSDLHFDETITELLLGSTFVGEVLFDTLSEKEATDNIINIKNIHRERLLKSYDLPMEAYVQQWELHLDYESIVMDKMIDLKRVPVELLCVQSGRSFFHQHRMYSLMHQGYQLASKDEFHEKSQWFDQWNNQWFCRNGLTRFRLIDILQQYTDEWSEEFVRANLPEASSIDEIYEKMRELHRLKVASACRAQETYQVFIREHPELVHYARFVSESMDYNEELRLLRSQSVFNFIQGCRQDGKRPYAVFLDVLATRQQRIIQTYGSEIHALIKTE